MKTLMTSLLVTGAFLISDCAEITAQEIFTGYYLEDPIANPEDPMMGTIHIVAPEGDGEFEAVMDFTIVGCQRESSGTVKGIKTDQVLRGKWTGETDGRLQSGNFDGVADETGYAGTYNVDDGKQYIRVDGCIEYYVSPYGEFHVVSNKRTDPDENGEYIVQDTRALIETQGRRVGITPLDPDATYVVSISYVFQGATSNWLLEPAQQRTVKGRKVVFEFDRLKTEFDDTRGPFDDGWYLITVNSVNPRDGAPPIITKMFFPAR